MKILLVEDNLLNQKVVIISLRRFNYNIIPVTNGRDAIEQVKNNDFDLILMDLMLPEMDGYTITREIRNIENTAGKSGNVPIIALTANTLNNDREKCFESGMNDYLAKPFTTQELISIIEKYIREK